MNKKNRNLLVRTIGCGVLLLIGVSCGQNKGNGKFLGREQEAKPTQIVNNFYGETYIGDNTVIYEDCCSDVPDVPDPTNVVNPIQQDSVIKSEQTVDTIHDQGCLDCGGVTMINNNIVISNGGNATNTNTNSSSSSSSSDNHSENYNHNENTNTNTTSQEQPVTVQKKKKQNGNGNEKVVDPCQCRQDTLQIHMKFHLESRVRRM